MPSSHSTLLNIERHRRRRQAVLLACILATAAAAIYCLEEPEVELDGTPENTSGLSGVDWMHELLDGQPGRIKESLGMDKHVFYKLLSVLEEVGRLNDSRHVSNLEKLGIFLYTCVSGQSNRKVQERFQRSGDTISK